MIYPELLRKHLRDTPEYQPVRPVERNLQHGAVSLSKVVKLDANENPYGPLPEVMEAVARLRDAQQYPDPESRRLRTALSEFHGISFENILAGAGADELIDLVIRIFLDPGDALIDCPPTFGMYSFDAGVQGARVLHVPRKPDFRLDIKGLENAVATGRPKLVFIANPNNPDGGMAAEEDLDRVLALPVMVILDEAYIDFAPAGKTRISEAVDRSNLIVLRTFSKWAGLAGFRVGYGVFPGWLMPALWKAKQPYNVSSPGQEAAWVSLAHADRLARRRDRIVAERTRLSRLLASVRGLAPLPSSGNFILCRVERGGGEALKTRLAKKGVFVRSYRSPGLGDYIRISVGTPEQTDRLAEALHTIEQEAFTIV